MTGNSVIAFILFWGIWLLVPVLIDGSAILSQLLGVWSGRWRRLLVDSRYTPLTSFPMVTLVLPVNNGARGLSETLRSIRTQTYPTRQIEVVVVDNGSTDDTERAFMNEQAHNNLRSLQWISLPIEGKASALNAGIHVATGDYIGNVDSDVRLHPDAILHMVKAFESDSKIGAATAAIEIAARDGPEKGPFQSLMRECEFVEYLTAFRVGRQHQTIANSVYTLAGAFSLFRRRVLLGVGQYSNRTMSEDTDLTFMVRERFPNATVACVAEAIAYVQPASSLSALYSQRVRWQRGELEVAACHPELLRRNLLRMTGMSPVKTLLVDHTLAFPRVVWTFFLPALILFGYPLQLVASATLVTYLCYIVMDSMTIATCYMLVHEPARQRLRRHWWIIAVTPAYRFILFWFRFGGFLTVLTEPAQWHTESPWELSARQSSRLMRAFLQWGRGSHVPVQPQLRQVLVGEVLDRGLPTFEPHVSPQMPVTAVEVAGIGSSDRAGPATAVEVAGFGSLDRATSHLRFAQLRVTQTVGSLEARAMPERDWMRDIPLALNATIEELRKTSDPTDSTLWALVQTTAGGMEAALDQGLNEALDWAPVSVAVELFEALRSSRMAQFFAYVAADDLAYVDRVPTLASFIGKARLDVEFQGILAERCGRGCVVSGVPVVLPADEAALREIFEGTRVAVRGVVGPGATVFATEIVHGPTRAAPRQSTDRESIED